MTGPQPGLYDHLALLLRRWPWLAVVQGVALAAWAVTVVMAPILYESRATVLLADGLTPYVAGRLMSRSLAVTAGIAGWASISVAKNAYQSGLLDVIAYSDAPQQAVTAANAIVQVAWQEQEGARWRLAEDARRRHLAVVDGARDDLQRLLQAPLVMASLPPSPLAPIPSPPPPVPPLVASPSPPPMTSEPPVAILPGGGKLLLGPDVVIVGSLPEPPAQAEQRRRAEEARAQREEIRAEAKEQWRRYEAALAAAVRQEQEYQRSQEIDLIRAKDARGLAVEQLRGRLRDLERIEVPGPPPNPVVVVDQAHQAHQRPRVRPLSLFGAIIGALVLYVLTVPTVEWFRVERQARGLAG